MLTAWLRVFFEVTRQGGVMAASRHLQMSQPSITSQLRKLEEHYQIELFSRRNGRLILTDTAARLLPKVEQLLQQEADLEFELRQQSERQAGQLRIGATGPFYLLPLLARLRATQPALQVDVQFGNSAVMLDALLNYQVDLAVTSQTLDDARLMCRQLASSPLVLLVPSSDTLAQHKSVPCQQLQGAILLTREAGSVTQQAVDTLLTDHQIRLQRRLQLGSREAVREGVAQGLGWALMAAGEVGEHPRLRAIALSDSQHAVHEYLYLLRQRAEMRSIRSFLQLVEHSPLEQSSLQRSPAI